MLAHRARGGRAVLLPAPNWHALVPALSALHAPAPEPAAGARGDSGVTSAASAAASTGPDEKQQTVVPATSAAVTAARDAVVGPQPHPSTDNQTAQQPRKQRRSGRQRDQDFIAERIIAMAQQRRERAVVCVRPATVCARHTCAVQTREVGRERSATESVEAAQWSLRERQVRQAPRDALRDSVHALRVRLCELDETARICTAAVPAPGTVPRDASDAEGQLRSAELVDSLQRLTTAQCEVHRLRDTVAVWELHAARAALSACVAHANGALQLLHGWYVLRRAYGLYMRAVARVQRDAPELMLYLAEDNDAAAEAQHARWGSKNAARRLVAQSKLMRAAGRMRDAINGYGSVKCLLGPYARALDAGDDECGSKRSERCALRVECW